MRLLKLQANGVSEEALKSIRYEQEKLFHQPFEKKVERKCLNIPKNSYRWGNPMAFCLRQLSWSEAFHLSMADISRINEECKSLRLAMEKFSQTVSGLAKTLAEVLAQNLGLKPTYLKESCPPYSSYLRLNRYPPCPYPSKVFGLLPHTDSDFLTMVYQDYQVGGLQLLKDGRWLSVKPNPEALVINIGDLFQALSNGVYKSIKHRVVGAQVERFSAAYFFCPSNDTIIESCSQPAVYREFSFREYKRQVERDVQETGDKIGLKSFLQ
ncbi:hypothetical protein UlMin_003486 [Ulmus minor]